MKFNSIVDELSQFIKTADIFSMSDPNVDLNLLSSKYVRRRFYDEYEICINSESEQHLDNASNLFLNKSKDNEKLSDISGESYIQNKLLEIAIDAAIHFPNAKNEKIVSELQMFFSSLVKEENFYYIGVGNLKLSKEYYFGKIHFIPNTSEFISKYCKEKPDSHKFFERFDRHVKLRDNDKIFAFAIIPIYSITVDKGAEIAYSILRQHLNVLQCFTRNGIFIEGDPTDPRYYYQVSDADLKYYNFGCGDSGICHYHSPFDYDDFAEKNSKYLAKLDSYLKNNLNQKDPSPQLDQKIVNSLDWLGDSMRETNDPHKLLKLIISLESLLLDKHDSAKRLLLSERCAFLLGNKSENRIKIKTEIEDAYRLRNEIVHSGAKDLIPPQLLNRLFWIILHMNHKIIVSEKFKNFKDILDYVEQEKYG